MPDTDRVAGGVVADPEGIGLECIEEATDADHLIESLADPLSPNFATAQPFYDRLLKCAKLLRRAGKTLRKKSAWVCEGRALLERGGLVVSLDSWFEDNPDIQHREIDRVMQAGEDLGGDRGRDGRWLHFTYPADAQRFIDWLTKEFAAMDAGDTE